MICPHCHQELPPPRVLVSLQDGYEVTVRPFTRYYNDGRVVPGFRADHCGQLGPWCQTAALAAQAFRGAGKEAQRA